MAQTNKKDEFYTQLSDIEAELKYYKKYFKGKVVYCNCDDSAISNFTKFFVLHFQDYGIKTHLGLLRAQSHKYNLI